MSLSGAASGALAVFSFWPAGSAVEVLVGQNSGANTPTTNSTTTPAISQPVRLRFGGLRRVERSFCFVGWLIGNFSQNAGSSTSSIVARKSRHVQRVRVACWWYSAGFSP